MTAKLKRSYLVPVDGVDQCAFDLATIALASGTPTGCPDCPLVVVPDLAVMEQAVNGHPAPDTYRLIRDDGRTVHLYRRAVPS